MAFLANRFVTSNDTEPSGVPGCFPILYALIRLGNHLAGGSDY
jgi:hypothetical protein